MARLNEILVGRFARFLQKHYGIKGPVPVASLAPEIMPVHNLFFGVENRFLEGWNRYGQGLTVAANAGQTGGVRLRNPAGSNTIVVIELLSFWTATTMEMDVGYAASGAGDYPLSVAGGRLIDGRETPISQTISSTNNTSQPNSGIFERAIALANTMIPLIVTDDQEICLPPAATCDVTTTLANTAFTVNMIWRERPQEESELK